MVHFFSKGDYVLFDLINGRILKHFILCFHSWFFFNGWTFHWWIFPSLMYFRSLFLCSMLNFPNLLSPPWETHFCGSFFCWIVEFFIPYFFFGCCISKADFCVQWVNFPLVNSSLVDAFSRLIFMFNGWIFHQWVLLQRCIPTTDFLVQWENFPSMNSSLGDAFVWLILWFNGWFFHWWIFFSLMQFCP